MSETIDDLQKNIDRLKNRIVKNTGNNTMIYYIGAAVVVPVIVGGSLLFTQPKFVQSKVENSDGLEYEKSKKKLVMYTLIISFVFWSVLYGWWFFQKSKK